MKSILTFKKLKKTTVIAGLFLSTQIYASDTALNQIANPNAIPQAKTIKTAKVSTSANVIGKKSGVGIKELDVQLNEIRKRQKAIQDVLSQNATLSQQITDNNLQNTATETEIANFMGQIAEFLTKKENVLLVNKIAANLAADQKQSFMDNLQKLTPLIDAYKKGLEALDTKENNLKALQSSLEKANQESDSIKTAYQAKQDQYQQAKASASGTRDTASSDLAGKADNLKVLEAQKVQLRSDIATLTAEVQSINTLLSDNALKVQEAKVTKTKTAGLMGAAQVAAKKAESEAKQSDLSAKNQQLIDLSTQINALRGDVSAPRSIDNSALTAMLTEIGTLNKQLTAANKKIAETKAKIGKIETDKQAAEAFVQEKKKALMEAYTPVINALVGLPSLPSVEASPVSSFASEQAILNQAGNILRGKDGDLSRSSSPNGMSTTDDAIDGSSLGSPQASEVIPAVPNNSLADPTFLAEAQDNNPLGLPSSDETLKRADTDPVISSVGTNTPELRRVNSAPVFSSLKLYSEKDARAYINIVDAKPTALAKCQTLVRYAIQSDDGAKKFIAGTMNASKTTYGLGAGATALTKADFKLGSVDTICGRPAWNASTKITK
jgi:hypothetical protein